MKDELLRQTGLLLRQRRQEMRLTLVDISRRSGVTVAQLSRIENGLVDPRLSTLVRILDATGGSLADVDAVPPRTVSIDEVLRRQGIGRMRIERSGFGASDVAGRLDRRDHRGEDTTAERAIADV